MKTSLTIALVLATISTASFAQDPAPAATPPTQAPAAMPMHDGSMMGGNKDRAGKHMERVFEEMDTNKDSVISKEESAAFGAKKFDERDANKDGKVTKEEWEAFRKARMDSYRQNKNPMPPTAPAPTDKK